MIGMSEFKSCPVCQEQSYQCLSCGSYVVNGDRIYYEKLKDFGATKDHEVRFINRIQKHHTTAFFHNGKLYTPSRQGRSVPLAIGLQWDAWQEQQAKIDELNQHIKRLESKLDSLGADRQELVGQVNDLQKQNAWLSDVAERENKRANNLQQDKTSTTILLGKTIQEKNELQKRIDEYKKLTTSIRNEFDLWSDDSEFADVIEAQIENLEALRGDND